MTTGEIMARYTGNMATKTRRPARAKKEPSNELIRELWRKHDELQVQFAESDKRYEEVMREAAALLRALRRS
jgi:hypothetical protein